MRSGGWRERFLRHGMAGPGMNWKRWCERLIERKTIVRELILAFRGSPRRPFPEWME